MGKSSACRNESKSKRNQLRVEDSALLREPWKGVMRIAPGDARGKRFTVFSSLSPRSGRGLG